jgi:hypothetical protein
MNDDSRVINVAAITELADFIEKATLDFNMDEAYPNPECGTAGCIGGHAAVLWPDIRIDNMDTEGGYPTYTWDDELLAEKLGIEFIEAEHLCYPDGIFRDSGNSIYYRCSYNISRAQAVETLRNLAKTEEVVWRENVPIKESV